MVEWVQIFREEPEVWIDLQKHCSVSKQTPPCRRRLQGEWYFRRALDGMAMEDLFICPSRDTREENPQPDGEYGAAVRMYSSERRCYDMTYICSKGTTRLEVRKEGDVIACTVLEKPSNQWRFVKVTEDTFHWQNVTKQAEGLQVNCEVFARRIR